MIKKTKKKTANENKQAIRKKKHRS